VASVYLVAGPARATIARRLAERLAGVHVEAAAGADIDALWRTGASVVVEYEGALALLGEYRTWLRSRPCHVVVVHPPDAPCDDAAPRVGLWLETDAHTAEETVDAILGATLTPRSPTLVVDYDPAWPAQFDELARPIRAALAALEPEVEHVGSTSVPGLAAKPIVDVDVVVRTKEDVPAAIEGLRTLGYVYQGDKGIPGREAFLWPPHAAPHHVYVVVAGSKPHVDHLAFRDHLRAHPEVAAAYAELKRGLAERFGDDRFGYTDAKTSFIAGVLAS